MSFHAYRGNAFDYTHENKVFNQLHDLLAEVWVDRDESLHLLGNFFVDGRDVDALIIKRNAIIVIDFKDYGGELHFSENGRWHIDGKEVRGGSKTNPYHQIRENKFSLLEYLQREVSLKSSPNLGHIAGLCLFHRKIEFDSQSLPGPVSRWFHISDMDRCVRDIDAIVSNAINLHDVDIQAFLSRLNVPYYYPDGQPKVTSLVPSVDELSEFSLRWSPEQQTALVKVNDWLAGALASVLLLSGAHYTGKRKVLMEAMKRIVAAGKTPVLIAPNARLANAYKGQDFEDCQSIYSWLYAGRPSEFKNDRAVYSVSVDLPDPETDVLIFVEAHLLGDEHYATDTVVYGSGYLLRDLFDALEGKYSGGDGKQDAIAFNKIPKMIVVGDVYQLARGSLQRSFIYGQILEQRDIDFEQYELQGQLRFESSPVDLLDFQAPLIKALAAEKFVRLPILKGSDVCEIQAGVHTDVIATGLLHWPKQSVMLCAKNDQAFQVNRGIRGKYLQAIDMARLVVGDIVDFHNRTPNLAVDDGLNLDEQIWVYSGEFGRITQVEPQVSRRSILLKGRDVEISLEFAQATVELATGKIVRISYLPEYLAAEKPELTTDQLIALQIWARQDAEQQLINEKKELESLKGVEDERYRDLKVHYNERLTGLLMASPILNAARLRYGYALTVHRAQTYLPFPHVVVNALSAHDTENPATGSYFRWLYTASVCSAGLLKLLEYPVLTPLSEADWQVAGAKIAPLVVKSRFYFDTNRQPTEIELSMSPPDGFSNPSPQLLALYLAVGQQIAGTEWRVSRITQHNYCEHYLFEKPGGLVELKFSYNGKFEVSLGSSKVLEGDDQAVNDLRQSLQTMPILSDENIVVVLDEFKQLIALHGWNVVSVDEKLYKVFVVIGCESGCAKVELNVPRKGVVSSIKLQQAESNELLEKYTKEFVNG